MKPAFGAIPVLESGPMSLSVIVSAAEITESAAVGFCAASEKEKNNKNAREKQCRIFIGEIVSYRLRLEISSLILAAFS